MSLFGKSAITICSLSGIEVAPTVAGVKAGRDEVLEKAVQFINGR